MVKMIDEGDFQRYLFIKRGLTSGTVVGYKSKLRQLNKWLAKEGKDLDKISIELFLEERSKTTFLLNGYIYFIKVLEDYLKDRGIQKDLSTGFKTRKQERPPIQILSPQEIENLITTTIIYKKKNPKWQQIDETYRVFTEALYLTCARVQELASLQIKNVDMVNGWITFTHTKGKKYRIVPFQEPLISHLKPFVINKKLDDLVFPNIYGNQINTHDYWDNLNNRARLAGIERHIHPHILRHSGASHMIQNGVPLEIVSQILGHADVSTTFDNYIHLKNDTLKEAINKLPMYQSQIPPDKVIKGIINKIKSWQLQDDKRFIFKLLEGTNSVEFILYII